MLYQNSPKTVDEIESDLQKFTQRDRKLMKIMWIVFGLSLPMTTVVLAFPEWLPDFISVSIGTIITATMFAMSSGMLFIYKVLIPQNSEFHYVLLKPASEKKVSVCEHILSHDSMQEWKEYVDKVKLLGRTIYNYEYDAIYAHWQKQSN